MAWLLIDADDTLWENNIYFERAFDRFVEYLNHSHLTPLEIRQALDEIELESIRVHGYGAKNFGRNLQQCFRRLVERHHTEMELAQVMALAEEILHQPMELLEGVEETLAYLASRHHLTLFSKGHPDEQQLKLDRSGLRRHFTACCIVKEKDSASYNGIVAQHGLPRPQTWMVGNSPKSDINPALAAGLGAVLVPHVNTWSLEQELLPEPSERFRIVRRFADLQALF